MKTEDCFVTDTLREVYSLKRGERARRATPAVQGFCISQTSEAGHGQHEAVCLPGYRALFSSSVRGKMNLSSDARGVVGVSGLNFIASLPHPPTYTHSRSPKDT